MKELCIKTVNLLVVSRDSFVLGSLLPFGQLNNWQIEAVSNTSDAIDKIRYGIAFDLLLFDLPKEYEDDLQALCVLRSLCPSIPILLIDRAGNVDREQESIRMGDCEYLTRPIDMHELELAIRRNLSVTEEEDEIDVTGEDVEPLGNGAYFIGASPSMRKLRAQVTLLAEIDLPVFIFGEFGSGKETVARLLHRLSIRSGFAFTRVKCAALPEELLEHEIFGSGVKDVSLTLKARRGKLERSNKGVVFFDQITEMPLRLQARLAQVLQSGQFVKKGTSESVNVDIRVVASSCKSFDQAISERKLHPDLARQLGMYELQVPALRNRKEEIPILSRHFMHRLARHYGLQPRDFTPEVSEAWAAYEWPGNLRELEQSVKRYLIAGDKGFVLPRISFEAGDEVRIKQRPSHGNSLSYQSEAGICGYKSLRALLQSIKGEAEKNAIAFALQKTGWNRKAAARLLKTSYRTVLYKIEQYQLSTSDFIPSSVTTGVEDIHGVASGNLRK